jgi:LacI family transcriptional regulator
VAVGGASGMSMQMPAASLDTDSFFIKAVEHLVQRGRRRIAMIAPPDVAHVNMFKPLAKAMAGFGLSPCPYLMQESPSQSTSAARNLAHLLMRLPAGERPDGLIIADDNLVEHASAGIVDAMVRVPEELEMVAHCNFPWPTPSVVKARRLGYDAGEVIATCLRCLDQQRARPRQRVADPKPIPARFEDELTPVAAPVTPML